jgi:hypothetical protein
VDDWDKSVSLDVGAAPRRSTSSLDMPDTSQSFVLRIFKWFAIAYSAIIALAVALAWVVDLTGLHDPREHLGADFIVLLLTLPLSKVIGDHLGHLFPGPLGGLYVETFVAALQVGLAWLTVTFLFKSIQSRNV